MAINNIKTKYILYLLFLWLGYTAVYWRYSNTYIGLKEVSLLGYFAVVQLLITLYSWYKISGVVIDAFSVFTIVFYCFNLSQPILETLGLSVEFRQLWGGGYGTSNNSYFSAVYFSMASALFFHIGALIAHKGSSSGSLLYNDVDNSYIISSIRKAAFVFSLFSAPFYIYNLVKSIAIVQVFGYQGLYNIEYTSRVFAILGDMFTPAMIALFTTSMLDGYRVKLVGVLVDALIFLPPFILGGKANAMIVLAIVYIIIASIKKVNLKRLVLGAVLILGMLYISNIITSTRIEGGRSVAILQEASKESESPIISTIQEMGWSMYPLVLTMESVPYYKDYSYGASYFWAVVSLIPNLGFWSGEHPGKKNDPAQWLNEKSGENYGIGYSMVAGAYNELGYIGLLIMFLYGVLFCKIFANVSPEAAFKKPLQFIFALLFLWYAIKFVRNSLNGIARGLAYYVLPIYLLSKFYIKGKLR